MENQQVMILKASISFRYYWTIVLLSMLSFPILIHCLDNRIDLNNHAVIADSTKNQIDSIKQTLLTAHHQYKMDKQADMFKLNWLDDNYKFMYNLYDSQIAESELFGFSRTLYMKYYMNKIELLNFNNYAYLYLDLKQAQNYKGALQVKIPFSNFHRAFEKKHNIED